MWDGKIALVNPPTAIGRASYLAPPIGLSQVAAALDARPGERKISIIDLALELNEGAFSIGHGLVDEATARLLEADFDTCAFSVQCFNLPVAEAIAARLKRTRPTLKIVFGGHHAALANSNMTKVLSADVVTPQSAEHEILGDAGVILKPALHLLPDLSRYAKVSRHPTGLVEVARGCPFDCSYCSIPETFGRKVSRKPTGDIVDEIVMWRTWNFSTVHLVDDTFTASPRHFSPLLELLSEIGPNFSWSAMTRADLVDPLTLEKLGRAHCSGLLYGIDSGSSATLKRISKRVTKYPDIAELARWNVEAGIAPTFYFLIDFAEDTIEDLELTVINAARASIIDPGSARLNLVRIVPGTRLGKASGSLEPNFEAPYADTLRETVGNDCREIWDLIQRHPAVFSTYFCSPCSLRRSAMNAFARYGSMLIQAFPLTFLEICNSHLLAPVLQLFGHLTCGSRDLDFDRASSALAEAVDSVSEAGIEFFEFECRRAAANDCTQSFASRVDAAAATQAALTGSPSLQATLTRKPRFYRIAAGT